MAGRVPGSLCGQLIAVGEVCYTKNGCVASLCRVAVWEGLDDSAFVECVGDEEDRGN